MTVAPQMMSSARTGNGNDCWQTPDVVLERVRLVGEIHLDPCTAPDNPTQAAQYYTGDPWDGLVELWFLHTFALGLVYVNPPYSTASEWAAKMVVEAQFGTPIVSLVAARPDTRWWKALWDVADAVAFWRGRLKFKGAPSSAPFPSALFGINVSQRRFKRAFGDVAEVVTP